MSNSMRKFQINKSNSFFHNHGFNKNGLFWKEAKMSFFIVSGKGGL